MSKSKRSLIFEAFYQEVSKLKPAESGTWRKKDRKPILRIGAQECPAFYVFDFQEKVTQEARQRNEKVQATLYIILEFWIHHTLSEDPSDKLNSILWDIQQAFAGNTLGGLCQIVSEVGSKFKVESAEQRVVSAEVAFSITYIR